MKLSHLKQLLPYFLNFKKIFAIYRVADTTIKVSFDKNDHIFFDMKKGDSKIFKAQNLLQSKVYNAPFDVILTKRLNNSHIKDIELVNGDKVLRFKCLSSSSYKELTSYLQFEFTGKHTNVIILDENLVVLEALRHIDKFSSFREVRVGKKLLDIPKANFVAKEYPLDNVERFLYDTYIDEQTNRLSSLKKQKTALLEAKLKTLQRYLDELEDEQSLRDEASMYAKQAEIFLVHMHTIKPYQKRLVLKDYDQKDIAIEFEKELGTTSQMSEHLFAKSKKAKQKASNLHIQKESLEQKIRHLELFINSVKEAKDISSVELLFPTIKPNDKKLSKNDSIEIFYIQGYKVSLGKNEKGNIFLLQNAKAKDIWLHLKDRPSTHVIISTDKQNIPLEVIKTAAKLCVDFSTTQKDRFLVDYTQRREVSIKHGANVLYNNYKTVEVNTNGNRTYRE